MEFENKNVDQNIENFDSNFDVKISKKSDSNNLFTKREWILRYATPFKSLMFMAGPMIIITLVNALYGIVDKQLTLNYAISAVISKKEEWGLEFWKNGVKISDDNLEDIAKQLINVSTQYSNTIIIILTALSLLTSIGTSIRWGQAMGRRNREEMDNILITGIIQTFIMSILAVILLYLLAPVIICAQSNISYSERETSLIYNLSISYVNKFILGFPLLLFATFLSTLLRTEGKVWWIIGINLLAITLNIIFGEIFMENANDENKMAGAVYGSMVAWSFMIISSLTVITMSKDSLLRPKLKNFNFDSKLMLKIWGMGFSPFLSNLIFAISNFIMTLLITTMHDYNSMASTMNELIQIKSNGHTLMSISPAIRVLSSGSPWITLLWAPIIGMMQGGNVNYAYNRGSEKRFKIIQIYRLQLLITISWGLAVLIIISLFGSSMLQLFDGPKNLHWWFVAYLFTIFVSPISFCGMSVFQGIGKGVNATAIAITRSLFCGITFTIIGWSIVKYTGISGNGDKDWIIFLCFALSEFPAAIMAIIFVSKTANKMIAAYRANDKKDNFTAPSYLTASLNEVTVRENKTIDAINHSYDVRVARAKNHEEVEWLEEHRKTKISNTIKKMNKKRDQNVKKFKYLDYIPSDDRITNLKNALIAKEKKLDDSSMNKEKISLWKEKQENKINKIISKSNSQINSIESGNKKVTPFSLLFFSTSPQPLNKYKDWADANSKN